MSSFGGNSPNPKPWPPYATTYTDCSQGICSVYCPQWCYILFPPPPSRHSLSSGAEFSPVIIAVIGVLATAFIIICYFLLISKYCRRRGDGRITMEFNEHIDLEAWQQQPSSNNVGLDEAVIRQITVCKYKKNDALIQGTECSVCLGEFQEEESLRLLPKCCHAFHVNCIDAWFKSHSSCPICRANIVLATQNDVVNVAALEYRPAVARVFVMESCVRQETVVVVVDHVVHVSDDDNGALHLGSSSAGLNPVLDQMTEEGDLSLGGDDVAM